MDGVPAEQAAETVRQLQTLATPEGAAALSRAAALLADGTDAVSALTRLRAEVGTDLAGPAWGVARQRQKARSTFGDDADRLMFTSDTLEQAGRPALADRRAARLLAAGGTTVADLGCAAGTDTIALARAGARVVAVDRDPVARQLTRMNAAALGLTGVEVVDGDVVELVTAAADGRVAGCDAAVLDPARRAGGRRQLDPDRWSPPWSTVAALLDAVPTAVVKVAPGLDHDRVPPGVEAEWVSVGGSIVEALLWGRGPSATWRRATLVHGGTVAELTATEDPGLAPTGPVREWLHEPDPAVIRSGLVACVAGELDATLVDPTIAYLTSDAAAASPWVSSHRVSEVLPFNLKRLRALLRTRGIGRVVVKKRGSPIEPEGLARQLRGPGSGSAVVVVTRVAGAPTVLVCDPPMVAPTDDSTRSPGPYRGRRERRNPMTRTSGNRIAGIGRIGLAAVASVAISTAWYTAWGNRLGRLHPAYAGGTRPPAWVPPVELARSATVATGVAALAHRTGVAGTGDALALGAGLWTAFPLVLLSGSVVHEKVPWQLAAIHAGDWLLKLLTIAAVVGGGRRA